MTLERAIEIAAAAHAGQVDKGGHPYILHPLRVMLAVSERARVVAVLHDVIEDGGHLDRMDALSSEEFDALDALTRRRGEPWDDYLGRVEANPLAVEVKLADLRDNMDVTRLRAPLTMKDWARLEKYRAAHERLCRAARSPGGGE